MNADKRRYLKNYFLSLSKAFRLTSGFGLKFRSNLTSMFVALFAEKVLFGCWSSFAKARIQSFQAFLDSRFRGSDRGCRFFSTLLEIAL